MIFRLAWYASLAAIALVTTGLQLDKQAGSAPGLAPIVPEPFRSVAQARIVATGLAEGNAEATLAQAERLVARRPAPAQNLRLLALAQYEAGQPEKGSLSIQLAAKRGWRDITAQEAMARLAVSADDIPEAARRYTALLARPETPDARLEELGPAVFSQKGGPGRLTMAAIMGDSERLGDIFLRRGPRVMPPDAFSEVTIRSIENGAVFDCAILRRTVAALTLQDEGAGAALGANVPPRCRRQPD